MLLSRRDRSKNNTTFALYARADSSGLVCRALILVAIVPPSFAPHPNLTFRPSLAPRTSSSFRAPPPRPSRVVNLPGPSRASACIKHPVRVFDRSSCRGRVEDTHENRSEIVENRKQKQINGHRARPPTRERSANVLREYEV